MKKLLLYASVVLVCYCASNVAQAPAGSAATTAAPPAAVRTATGK
jgi:hypothetical protein